MNFTGLWLGHKKPAGVCQAKTAASTRLTLFRAEFNLQNATWPTGEIWISADSRYKLYLNGTLIGVGPAKSRQGIWFVDRVALPATLREGANLISVEVLSYLGEAAGNASVLRLGTPGIYIQANGDFKDLQAAHAWKSFEPVGAKFLQGTNTQFLGIQEMVDGRDFPAGWSELKFDDSSWTPTEQMSPQLAVGKDRLRAREIPQLTFNESRFTRISKQNSIHDWIPLILGSGVEVAPGSNVYVDLDAGELVTAFLTLQISGGSDASISIEAAECYELPPIEVPWIRKKGKRDEPFGQDLYGDPDSYVVAGNGLVGSPEIYRPYWFRTFRFVRLRVRTGSSPIRIEGLNFQIHNYPLQVEGGFTTSNSSYLELWKVSLRTLINCMHETFEDCPFYEQLQYAMDTRSQALFTMYISNDDRLVRRAIEDFAASGDMLGLTASQTPSNLPQIIPNFALFWVYMVRDHLMHRGDLLFTKSFLPRIEAVLSTFRSALSANGLVVSPKGEKIWNFVDWTELWKGARGVPHLGAAGENTISTFMYVTALRQAATVARFVNELEIAAGYEAEAQSLSERIRKGPAFDPVSGLYRDSTTGEPTSMHAQLWAVLAGIEEGVNANLLLSRASENAALAPCSYAMSLALFDSFRSAGVDQQIDWKPWRDMLDLGLTTWAEDVISNRSDCHAWGSVPLQHFPKYELGIEPLLPGFERVGISPSPSSLKDANGVIPTPRGDIVVSWERQISSHRRIYNCRIPGGMEFEITPNAEDVITERADGFTKISFTLRN